MLQNLRVVFLILAFATHWAIHVIYHYISGSHESLNLRIAMGWRLSSAVVCRASSVVWRPRVNIFLKILVTMVKDDHIHVYHNMMTAYRRQRNTLTPLTLNTGKATFHCCTGCTDFKTNFKR